jgi:hypothetical protein
MSVAWSVAGSLKTRVAPYPCATGPAGDWTHVAPDQVHVAPVASVGQQGIAPAACEGPELDVLLPITGQA